jgi:hypothetical protein
MNKFEQLIEYVINNEEAKAKELFHDIVVEKSRQIYEEMMEEETIEEADESIEEAEEMEESEEVEEGMELGGDQAESLMRDVEVEEEGLSEEDDEFDDTAEKDGHDLTKDMEGEGDLEDRVVDLEDKLDELMAEFEAAMGGEESGMDGMDGEEAGMGDTPGMTGVEVADDELETEGMFNENITLKTVSTPSNPSVSSKSPVAANSGARGAVAKPVHATGDGGNGRPAPTTKDLIGKVQNTPAQGSVKLSPATKPHLAQATGVNTKSVTR